MNIARQKMAIYRTIMNLGGQLIAVGGKAHALKFIFM
jgi:hypothetical protein